MKFYKKELNEGHRYQKIIWDRWVFLFIFVFFAVNLFFLAKFPFVHSDEAWLAGLTRNIMAQGSFKVTETFFNLKIRNPHAIKSLFHIVQMPFIGFLGYNISSVRLLSLLTGCGILGVFYNAATSFLESKKKAFLALVLLALDVQFIASSHMARQDIIISFALILCLSIFLKYADQFSSRNTILLAVITGLSIGIHPNSFIVGVMCISLLLIRYLFFKSVTLKQIGLYALITALFAAIFVVISFYLDPNFVHNYYLYGSSEFDVFAPVGNKIAELSNYFAKLYHQISGTYYIPNIRPQMILFSIAAVLSALYALIMKKDDKAMSQKLTIVLSSMVAVIVGIVLIGRFSQLSIIFIFPMGWLLTVFTVTLFEKKIAYSLSAILVFLILSFSVIEIVPWLSYDYQNYLDSIAQFVPNNQMTIGNLNSEFYFENGNLLDYRNLAYLEENDMTFEEYVETYEVEYLIISDELTFIYENRPVWNIIYGDLAYMDQLNLFIEDHCSFVGSFVNNTYGIRIVEKINNIEDISIRVYKVNE